MIIINRQDKNSSATALTLADINYQEDIKQLWKKLVKEQKSDSKILSKEVSA